MSKRLKAEGWPQDNDHAWVFDEIPRGVDKDEPNEMAWMLASIMCPDDYRSGEIYAAPTVAELMDAVPSELSLTKFKHNFMAVWVPPGGSDSSIEILSNHLIDILALLWLELKTKGLA